MRDPFHDFPACTYKVYSNIEIYFQEMRIYDTNPQQKNKSYRMECCVLK